MMPVMLSSDMCQKHNSNGDTDEHMRSAHFATIQISCLHVVKCMITWFGKHRAYFHNVGSLPTPPDFQL